MEKRTGGHWQLARSGWREMGLWLLGRRRLFRVTGASMEPTLPAGAVVLLDPNAYRRAVPREGEIVVAWHPRQPELRIVKRVRATVEVGGEERLILASDNADAGSDSRAFGPVSRGLVLGRVSSRLR